MEKVCLHNFFTVFPVQTFPWAQTFPNKTKPIKSWFNVNKIIFLGVWHQVNKKNISDNKETIAAFYITFGRDIGI